MSVTDSRLCFETQHQNTIQKIYFIKYKRFRGEALASIAANCSCRDEDKARSRELGTNYY
jgi:hypothetical protein